MDTNNSFYSSVDGVLFNKDESLLLTYPGGRSGNYAVPGTVTAIAEQAFQGCQGLAQVMVPGSVASLPDGTFASSSLTSIVLGEGVTCIGSNAFSYCGNLTNVALPQGLASIGQSAFENCTSLPSLSIPNSMTSIAYSTFWQCSSLVLISIPMGVTNIGGFAFGNCTSLQTVLLPETLTSIGLCAFFDCRSLTNLSIPGSLAMIGSCAFEECSNLHVFFAGNAPTTVQWEFPGDGTAYHLPGTAGWEEFSTETGLQNVLWNPAIQTAGPSFGIRSNSMGFEIRGTVNIPISLEASTDLAEPAWEQLTNVLLTNGAYYFSDRQGTNFTQRFYRIQPP